jgi:hypothetical protein
MKPLIALAAAALLTSGCGAAAAQEGSMQSSAAGRGDGVVSHTVDPNEPATPGRPTLVTPVPGRGGNAVLPTGLRVWVGEDGHVWARVTWWGGVAPCSVVRPVEIARRGTTVRLRLFEGSDAAVGTACVEIAMKKAVKVDLGDPVPGTYTVRAGRLARVLRVAV